MIPVQGKEKMSYLMIPVQGKGKMSYLMIPVQGKGKMRTYWLIGEQPPASEPGPSDS